MVKVIHNIHLTGLRAEPIIPSGGFLAAGKCMRVALVARQSLDKFTSTEVNHHVANS